jgi:hypothetical protein
MKAKLIKDHQEYMLINNERFVIATTDKSILEVTDKMKLSKQNCDEIFGIVDVEKLADDYFKSTNENAVLWRRIDFKEGFNKAMELNQPTEIEVEIEMGYVGECGGNNGDGCFQDSPGHDCGCFEYIPKLDDNGCLILKKL